MVSALKAQVVLLLSAASAACANSNTQTLVDFQVAEPPPVPSDTQTCTMMLLERTFGNSYGHPEIFYYTPPAGCGGPGSWAAVTLNFTVTSNGTQFDRLGVFSFHNTEIWRTSTPEPTHHGIIWTYTKDVTRYIPLFAKPGTFVLELNNIVNTKYNGEYATTLHATFYPASQSHPTALQSNLIVPISTMVEDAADHTSVPPAFSLNVTLPRNTVEIYAELFASGNGDEEFWYYNTADEYLADLPADTTYGGGPFREVRLLVDGRVAGVAFPYAVIFTGGINPSVWRPITAYGALDLPTYHLDLTPFVPIFADGCPHTLTLDVVSAEANHTLNQNWYLSGLLQVVTDPSGKPTTGALTRYDVAPYAETETSGSVGADLRVTVTARHVLSIEAVVVSGSGTVNHVKFHQDLNFTNTQSYANNATTQNVSQVSLGSVLSLHNGKPVVMDEFEYPLYVNVTYVEVTNTSATLYTSFDHSYNRQLNPAPFILGSTIAERQQAAGYLKMITAGSGKNAGNGTSSNTFSYRDTAGNTYYRDVDAAYNVITHDQQSGSLATNSYPPQTPYTPDVDSQATFAARLPGCQDHSRSSCSNSHSVVQIMYMDTDTVV